MALLSNFGDEGNESTLWTTTPASVSLQSLISSLRLVLTVEYVIWITSKRSCTLTRYRDVTLERKIHLSTN
jgi:hypothetical protein